MKKQIITLMGVVILTIGMLSGCGGKDNSGNEADKNKEATSVQDTTENTTLSQDSTMETASAGETTSMKIISEDEAKSIAFKDADVNESDVTKIRVRCDYDNGIQEYDVDFYIGVQEYEYTISAEDGAILEKDID